MLLCVWSALNPLSIHVTFTAIVPGEAKICKNVLKWWTFELTGWITGKLLKIDGSCCDAFDKHWILFSSMWHLPWLSQGRTQGRPKCALGWLPKLTHVLLTIAILLVTYCYNAVCHCFNKRTWWWWLMMMMMMVCFMLKTWQWCVHWWWKFTCVHYGLISDDNRLGAVSVGVVRVKNKDMEE